MSCLHSERVLRHHLIMQCKLNSDDVRRGAGIPQQGSGTVPVVDDPVPMFFGTFVPFT